MDYQPFCRKSLRIKGFNYAQEGHYYVTICTFEKQHLFGVIENKEMYLNKAGNIAKQCWEAIPDHFPNVKIHDYVIMPNHIHGIIEILFEPVGANQHSPQYLKEHSPQFINESIQKFESPKKTIGSVIRGFKIGVTKWMRENTNHQKFVPNQKFCKFVYGISFVIVESLI